MYATDLIVMVHELKKKAEEIKLFLIKIDDVLRKKV